MPSPKNPAIYEIINLVNGKRYIGSAVRLEARLRGHRKSLLENKHHSRFLQRSWNKYGEGSFQFRVLENVEDPALLIEREQHYIDTLKPEYNSAPVAGSVLGVKWSEEAKVRKSEQTITYFKENPEARARLSELNKGKTSSAKGRKATEEQRERISAASKRVWACPEYRQKMSEVHKGHIPTPESREKAAAKLRGRKLSPEHAATLAAKNAERNRSPEHRAKMSAYWKGRPKTPDQIAKMAATKLGKPAHNKGIPRSEEQKAKQSAVMKRKYQEDPTLRARISAAMKLEMAKRRTSLSE